jgi:hypothetical protein
MRKMHQEALKIKQVNRELIWIASKRSAEHCPDMHWLWPAKDMSQVALKCQDLRSGLHCITLCAKR